jgi:hypothetical protein
VEERLDAVPEEPRLLEERLDPKEEEGRRALAVAFRAFRAFLRAFRAFFLAASASFAFAVLCWLEVYK